MKSILISEAPLNKNLKPWNMSIEDIQTGKLIVTITGYKGSVKARFFVNKDEFIESVKEFLK